MTQKEKDLLLKDLSCRIPYNVKVLVRSWDEREMEYVDRIDVLYSINGDGYINTVNEDGDFYPEEVKPYLFPLSSMTEEQKQEYQYITERWMYDSSYSISDSIDWLNKNNFDYRGLIPMGLATDATGLNIY